MSKIIVVVLVVALAGCVGHRGAWRVVRVVDGDTFVAEGPDGKRTYVRLRRLNAPEMNEPGGPEAKAALEKRIGGRWIDMEIHARDRYGRAVATIQTEKGTR